MGDNTMDHAHDPAKKFDRKRFLRIGGIGAAAAVVAPAATAHAAPAAPESALVFNVKDFGARGDGIADDTAGIAATIKAAVAGGTVYFPPGDFRVNGEILIQANNILVRGAGWASRLTQTDASGKGKATLRFGNADGVAVRELSFTGRGTEHVAGDGNLSYNGVAAVRFDGCTNVTVSGCRIAHHAGGGIRWTGSLRGALFADNTITGIGGDPGPIRRGDNNNDFAIGQWNSSPNENIVIRGNTISGHCFGIGSGHGAGLVISGNVIHGIPGQHGMYLSAPGSAQIGGNVVRNVALNCVNVQIAKSAEVTVPSLMITDNVLHDAESGIVLNTAKDVATAGFQQPVIAGNSVRTMSEYGIAVNRTWHGSIIGNTVAGTGAYGLLLNGFSGAVRDNTVRETNWSGLYVDLIGDTHSAGNVFTDCARNTTGAPAADRLAYYVNAVRTTTVTPQPVLHSDADLLHAAAPEPATLRKCLHSSAGTAVLIRGLVNRTSKPWEFKGELLHLDFAYSRTADFSDNTHLNPSTPVYGRGRRELYGLQDPAAAGMTAPFQPGDTCWHAKPTAGGTPGWICITAGSPGTWKAMAPLTA
ncbi:right-handed parallel beta-helix repeat-containing protein [Crossiella sp. CA198]|uniref:right-handed parallel beta-helix repeat-containing protein n=1 Tax=Crossiella sp. CA198 TaxID=3455607 RepID=UPI003F8D6780